MAKKKVKKKNNNEYSPKKALKKFTKASVWMVQEELEHVEVDELITNIFMSTSDEKIQDLIKRYEKQLILSKLDMEKFSSGLHEFFLDTDKYIKENNLYKSFFKLTFYNHINLSRKGVNRHISNAYYDLLIQQYAYFKGGVENVVYGIRNDGSLMYVPEIGKNLSRINYELELCTCSEDMCKLFSKFGYRVNNENEVKDILTNDQMLTNMLFSISYLINDDTEYIFKKPFRNPTVPFKINPFFYENDNVNEIKNRLSKRQRLLPEEGLTAKFGNMFDIVEVFMSEEVYDNRMIMLYNVKFSDLTYAIGYYDINSKVFYDMWEGCSMSEFTHTPLENLVLQTYTKFTCDFTADDEELICLIESSDLNKMPIFPLIYPLIKYEIKETNLSNTGNRERNFDKEQYKTEYRNIKYQIRNLPVGETASESAIAMARTVGIELPFGKTFVKAFRKKVYIK